MPFAALKKSVQAILDRAIVEKVFPGCVLGIITAGGSKFIVPAGAHTYDTGAPAMKPDSIFDVASITKAVPTSTLALMALEEERIALDTPLYQLLPEFENSCREQVTVWHLLTQTLDHGYAMSSLKDLNASDLLHTILTHDFRSPPGTWFGFTNATSILLGMLVERVYNKPLDTLAQEKIFTPLHMGKTGFSLQKFERDAIVPTEIDGWRGRVIQGEIHDESAFVLRSIMVPGSAGLFSTVPDMLQFLQMLLRNGHTDDNQILQPASIRRIQENQLEKIGRWAALGWELNQMRFMGTRCSNRTIGKTGFTGCMIACDFTRRIALALLSNHTFPHRAKNADTINAVRRSIADIVFDDANVVM